MAQKTKVLLGVYFALPLVGFCVSLGAMASCALGSGNAPSPTDTGPSKKSEPPATCTAGTTETDLGDGRSWCCAPGHCDEKGAPVYHAVCSAAGERKVGRMYTYIESSCSGTFKRTEQWVSVGYECRSEDGIAPRWEYVEPSTRCTHEIVRACDESEAALPRAVITSEARRGDACGD